MLVRTFRLTDKLSNATLKLTIYLSRLVLQRLLGIRQAVYATAEAILLTLFGLLRGIWRAVMIVFGAVTSQANRFTERGQELATQRQQRMRQVMVQRADAAQLDAARGGEGRVIQDPMLARNRSLSAITVILLLILVGFLVLSPNDQESSFSGSGIIPTAALSIQEQPSIPTPTITPTRPSQLLSNVSGTLVFTLRQNGQDDIWALPVGSSQPIRMTDSLEDDRDPAWSPDGSQIAFTSRRDGFWNLYILDLSEGLTRQLTFDNRYVGEPAWSPDGAFIAYEAYTEETNNIDIYLISADGTLGPFQFTSSPLPDLNPTWRPDSNDIAYIGWRNGNQELLVLNTQSGQPEDAATNISNTPDASESNPRWSPEGNRIAYTSNPGGIDGIYVASYITPNDPPRLIGRGTTPTWNPVDGSSVFYAVPQGINSAVYLGQVDNFGVGANAVAFSGLVSDLDWTPVIHELTGFNPRTPPLYEENVSRLPDNRVSLALLNNIDLPPAFEPVLSDAVNDSYLALRDYVRQQVGYDLLGTLESAFWRPDRLPEPGQARDSWHYTGRAIAISRDLVFATPPAPIVVIREDTELGTTWRVMARVAESAQDGSLGEPLRALPWDFASRTEDPNAFSAGGRLMDSIPAGYYVDLTAIFRDFGWERVQADRTWRSNYAGVLFWQFQKTEGLSWREAMLQIYTEAELQNFTEGFLPQPPTAIPTAVPTQTPTGLPTAIPNALPTTEPTEQEGS